MAHDPVRIGFVTGSPGGAWPSRREGAGAASRRFWEALRASRAGIWAARRPRGCSGAAITPTIIVEARLIGRRAAVYGVPRPFSLPKTGTDRRETVGARGTASGECILRFIRGLDPPEASLLWPRART